ncbi:hypothetical protein HBH98_159650 [Parastagonospora nodorum]|nr:hypothetical protein HBI95_051890 [Parastagonospora nodorum]KAH4342568.1 hypothetical protein HBH98_159650 [Parastagonospora nodorum]KAH4399068.1 hypothetical protein HBH99_100970 [Parastagonospora nodorum]KAH5310377.1 hypothetical protein HBI12_147240 [Parastagonospora nodorum]KAH5699523.1 hypothetical protein HBI44_062900 [Parastagonospora nodorum]
MNPCGAPLRNRRVPAFLLGSPGQQGFDVARHDIVVDNKMRLMMQHMRQKSRHVETSKVQEQTLERKLGYRI